MGSEWGRAVVRVGQRSGIRVGQSSGIRVGQSGGQPGAKKWSE